MVHPVVRLRRLLVFAVAITPTVTMTPSSVVAKDSNHKEGGTDLRCSTIHLEELRHGSAPHGGHVVGNRYIIVKAIQQQVDPSPTSATPTATGPAW